MVLQTDFLNQSQLHGAGGKFPTDARQGDADRRHHEGHKKVGETNNEQGG